MNAPDSIDIPQDLYAKSLELAAYVQQRVTGPNATAVQESLFDIIGIAEDYIRKVLALREQQAQVKTRLALPEPKQQERPGEEPRVTLGRMLRELRDERGEQQATIAAAIGMSPPLLSQVEKGGRTIQPEDLKRLLQHYCANPDPFLKIYQHIPHRAAS